jgi:hypothetical protein
LWIIADPPWHIDAVGGRSHHQRHAGHEVVVMLIAEAANRYTSGNEDYEANFYSLERIAFNRFYILPP